MTLFAAESFFYHGMARWDFGLDSPNKAAAVLAFLLLPLLALAVRARREWVRWCAGLALVLVGYGLVRTFSRGGLVAFLLGALVLLAGLRKSLVVGRCWCCEWSSFWFLLYLNIFWTYHIYKDRPRPKRSEPI